MSLYKRGGKYWYTFTFQGERVAKTSRIGNKEVAREIDAAHRLRLAKGQAGIIERSTALTLAEFAPRFETAIVTLCADKPATVRFYQEKLRRLLADRQLAGARLGAIEEAAIDAYKQRQTRQASRYGRPLSPASVNRELATLRRAFQRLEDFNAAKFEEAEAEAKAEAAGGSGVPTISTTVKEQADRNNRRKFMIVK